MQKIYDALPADARGKSEDEFIIADIADAPNVVQAWGRGGCHAVLEVIPTPSGSGFLGAQPIIVGRRPPHSPNALPCSSRPIWRPVFLRCPSGIPNTLHGS
jgi:hypothetical protein